MLPIRKSAAPIYVPVCCPSASLLLPSMYDLVLLHGMLITVAIRSRTLNASCSFVCIRTRRELACSVALLMYIVCDRAKINEAMSVMTSQEEKSRDPTLFATAYKKVHNSVGCSLSFAFLFSLRPACPMSCQQPKSQDYHTVLFSACICSVLSHLNDGGCSRASSAFLNVSRRTTT